LTDNNTESRRYSQI